MSLVFNDCDEQYIGYEQILINLIQVDNDGNPYINIVDSTQDIDELNPVTCEYETLLSLIKRLIVYDDNGDYAISIATIGGAGVCPLNLDFQHICNSQYISLM